METKAPFTSMDEKMKKRTAFTLIELLVVIAVIAVLMGILLPSLNRARGQAKKTVCTAHSKGLMMAIRLYIDDNDGRTHMSPNNGLWDNAFEDPVIVKDYGPNDDYAYWGIAYKVYSSGRDIFHCPSHERVDDWPEYGWGKNYQQYFWHCSYGINQFITRVADTSGKARNVRVDYDIKRPEQMIVFHDALEQKMEVRTDSLTVSEGRDVNLVQWRYGGTMGDFPYAVSEYYRHGGRSVVAWLDGHVSEIRESNGEDVPRRWYTGLNNDIEWPL
jgi:prepilin-type N-terminal cleavage/methylation domain-containing protein/prepilin-type processing-associated H-X9-DG protein